MKRWNWILGVGIVALLAGCVTGSGNGSFSGLDQLATEAATMGRAAFLFLRGRERGERVFFNPVFGGQILEIVCRARGGCVSYIFAPRVCGTVL